MPLNKLYLYLHLSAPFASLFRSFAPLLSLFLTLDWVINHSVQLNELGARSHGLRDLEIRAAFFSTWLALWRSSFTSAAVLWGQPLIVRTHSLRLKYDSAGWILNMFFIHDEAQGLTLKFLFWLKSISGGCWMMQSTTEHCWILDSNVNKVKAPATQRKWSIR